MDPLVRLARVPRRPPTADHVAAGAILVWALLEALFGDGPGPTAARIGFALVVSVPLVVRRRAPFLVVAVISAATVVWAVHADTAESGTMPFPALLLTIFSVALYARTTALAIAGGAIAVAAMLVVLHTPFYDGHPNAGNTGILFFFCAGTWTAGWLVRRRARQARLAYEESGDLARSAVADERARIARELHDVVAHSVSIIAVQAGAAEQLIEQSPEAAREHLAAVRRTARETMGEMRRLLGVLRDDEPDYAPQPGLSRLPDLLDEVRTAGVPVELVESGEPRELPGGVDLVAFRVIQEALTNVRKHASGADARVALDYRPRELCIVVSNGPGVSHSPSANGAGHGLIGMRERVRIFGGHFEAGAQPAGGFRVHAVLPVDEEAA